MLTDGEQTQRIPTGYGTRKHSRLAQLKYAREQRRKSTDITGGIDSAVASGSSMAALRASGSMAVAESEEVDVCTGPGDTHSVSEPSIASSSQSDQPDVDDDGEVRLPVTDDRSGVDNSDGPTHVSGQFGPPVFIFYWPDGPLVSTSYNGIIHHCFI